MFCTNKVPLSIMEYFTTFSVYLKYFETLKNIGFFPYRIESIEPMNSGFQNDTNTVETSDSETIKKDRNRVYKLCRLIPFRKEKLYLLYWSLLGLFSFEFVFSIAHLFRYLYFIKNEYQESKHKIATVALVCWIIFMLQGTIIHGVFLFKRHEFGKLIEEWQKMEIEILQGEFSNQAVTDEKHEFPKSVRSFIAKNQWRKKWLMSFYFLSVFILIGLIIVNFLDVPRFGMYLYSVVDETMEIPWLKYFAIVFHSFIILCLHFSQSQLEILTLCFGQSMTSCLAFIKANSPCKSSEIIPLSSEEQQNTLHKLAIAVDKYERIQRVMQQFNQVFCWPLFIYKSISVIKFCSYIFIILRHRKTTPLKAVLIFYTVVFAVFMKICTLLTSLGKVYKTSVEFKESWEKVLPDIELSSCSTWHERRLKNCQPVGFMSGNFYQVMPFTILTFFSITTSYLIVLLQLNRIE